MRAAVCLAILIASPLFALANRSVDGRRFLSNNFLNGGSAKWVGKGEWRTNDGAKGFYTETVTLENGTFTAILTTDETVTRHEFKHCWTVRARPDGSFEMTAPGSSIVLGKGYCTEKICHYETKLSEDEAIFVEETLSHEGDVIHAVGSSTASADSTSGEPGAVISRKAVLLSLTPNRL